MPIQLNFWFFLIVAAFVILWKVDFFTTLLNLRSFQPAPPSELADVIDEEKFELAREYSRAKAVLNIGQSLFSVLLFFVFWWLGGFGWLDGWVRGFGFGSLVSGVIFVSALILAHQVLMLPFDWYSTFGIEAEFGFNRTTPGLFVTDLIKGLALSAVLGVPLLFAILWIFESVPLPWLGAWGITSLYMLFVVYISPAWILPMFNKFRPLEEGELKTEIHRMAEKCDFPLKEVSIMDGSSRSSKANAFFTGFGNNKRIVLFDTLVENHSVPELVTVLAHEIGHYKKRHLLQGLVIGILGTGIMFFVLGLLINNRSLFDAFGVRELSIYVSLVLFGILIQPLNDILSVAGNWLSRRNEYEADAYAREVTGQPEALVTALKKLSVDNLSHLTPHPAYVFLNYSHPPVVERIRALRAGESDG